MRLRSIALFGALALVIAVAFGHGPSDAHAQAAVSGGRQPVLSQSSGAPSAKADAEFKVLAEQAILIDAETGAIMYQLKAEERMHPASMSKLMTLALVFKAMKAGTLKPQDEFVMSVNAWRTGGAVSKYGATAMMVPVNLKVKLEDLVLGIIVQSGNDAAIAVAEGLAGTEQKFAALMNDEARRIGLKNSTFANATGLYDPEHLTTVADLALLARHIIREYPEYYPQFAVREFRYRSHKFFNRNPLIGTPLGVDGLKTGYIKESGYNLAASAVQNNRRLIAVVGGYQNPKDRREDTQRLLEWGFRSFTEFRLFDPGEVVGHARVYGGENLSVPLTGANGVSIILPRFPANQRIDAAIIYMSPLKPPIRKGDQIAKLRVTSSTRAVNEVPLYAAEDVQPGPIWRRGLDSLSHLAFGWIR